MEENTKRKKFIKIGDTRIRVGSIKDYGIEYDSVSYEKVYTKTRKTGNSILKNLSIGLVVGFDKPAPENDYDLIWEGDIIRIDEIRYLEIVSKIGKTYKKVFSEQGKIIEEAVGFIATEKDILEKEDKYLYISTYQNDTYEFYETEVDFDIEEKCSEIDEMFD